MENLIKDKKNFFEMCILTILMALQIIFFIIFFNYGKILVLRYVGAFVWILSAILGWLPIYTFRKKGKVLKGKSYISTTKLVDSGIYSIIRHPQYLAGILLSLAFIFISQHWVVLILGILIILILYNDMFRADKRNIKKFGKPYVKYMKKVPRANFILGIIKKLKIIKNV